jgi:hypothetical protein
MPVAFELIGELNHVTFSGVLSVKDPARAGEEIKTVEARFEADLRSLNAA